MRPGLSLRVENDELRAHWEKVFVRLLVVYREDFSRHTISEGKADDLLKELKDWMKRDDGEDGIPRPATTNAPNVPISPCAKLSCPVDRKTTTSARASTRPSGTLAAAYRAVALCGGAAPAR